MIYMHKLTLCFKRSKADTKCNGFEVKRAIFEILFIVDAQVQRTYLNHKTISA